ncbi:hypothetical protein EYC84_008231 [Monilinia fructicola]|uniref:Uncharacterized protein n=1 Tax=Monilinia fructicola TaxID=38448 RepID=A0A5M9JL40_MONFR|nr:hypothetical protein EYC84_008231 [Monilinia fructicola]
MHAGICSEPARKHKHDINSCTTSRSSEVNGSTRHVPAYIHTASTQATQLAPCINLNITSPSQLRKLNFPAPPLGAPSTIRWSEGEDIQKVKFGLLVPASEFDCWVASMR